MRSAFLPLSCLAALLVVASSSTCLVPDSNHCAHRANTRGHAFCRAQDPEFPLCSRCESSANGHNGCTDDAEDPSCLVGSPASSDLDPTEAATDTDGATDTTGSTICVPAECEALDPARPLCNNVGECVPCGELDGAQACAAAFPTRPVCLTADDDAGSAGRCVTCTETDPGDCSGSTPACDVASQACVACTHHSQCRDAWGSACHIAEGVCLPPQHVWYVDGDAGPSGEGTENEPYSTIAEAMSAMLAARATEGTIVLYGSRTAYDEAVTIDGAHVLAIVAAPTEQPAPPGESPDPSDGPPVLDFDSSDSLISITGMNTVVYLEGLTIRNGDIDPGIRIDASAAAYIDRCEIIDNVGGISVMGDAHLVLRNSIVTTRRADEAAVSIANATADIVYSTLAHTGTVLPGSTAHAITCPGSADGVSVRKSIVVSRKSERPNGWDCVGAAIGDSVGENIPLGDGNRTVCNPPSFDCGTDDIISTFFMVLTNLRLVLDHADAFVIEPEVAPSDPRFDIDDNPRPAASGHDYAGAHAPPPR